MAISRDAVFRLCREFWDDDDVPVETKLVLLKMVKHRHTIDKSPVVSHERTFEERFEDAKRLIAKEKERKSNATFATLQIASFLALPKGHQMDEYLDHHTLGELAAGLSRLRSMFLAEPLVEKQKSLTPGGRIQRNKTEANKVRNFELARCLLSRSSYVEVCHIIPFSFNASERKQGDAAGLVPLIRAFLPKAQIQDLEKLLSDTRGASDKSWNMLLLNPLLHLAWSRLDFALSWFDCQSVENNPGATLVRLKVHPLKTLPKNDKSYQRLLRKTAVDMMAVFEGRLSIQADTSVGTLFSVMVNGELKSLNPESENNPVDSAGMMDFFSHQPITEGHIVSTTIPSVDADNFRLMIDLQYYVILMTKMAGGADPFDWLFDSDPDSPFMAFSTYGRDIQSDVASPDTIEAQSLHSGQQVDPLEYDQSPPRDSSPGDSDSESSSDPASH